MGVAYVHVAVDETGSHHHSLGFQHGIGRDVGEVVGFADLRDPATADDDGPVGDDSPLRVHGDHVSGVVDLGGALGHIRSRSSGRVWVSRSNREIPIG